MPGRPELDSTLVHLFPDHGSQCVSIRYRVRLAEAGIESSVCSKSDSHCHALSVTINGLHKAEVVHRRSWQTRESVEIGNAGMGAQVQPIPAAQTHRINPAGRSGGKLLPALARQTSMVAF